MADFSSLLEPISPERPSGDDLYYRREFDDIKEARRQDDTAPQGLWERERKLADYKSVAKLIEDALRRKTKDLRLAVWLAEAWIYRDGVAGFLAGLRFLHSFVETFWDSFYPQMEGNDLEDRFVPLEWYGSYFDPLKGSSPKLAVCRLPLVKGKYDFFLYQESRRIGYAEDVQDSEPRKKARLAFINDGKLSAELFDQAFDETPKAFYKQLEADYKQALGYVSALNSFCREKFGKNPPSFGELRIAVENILDAVHVLLARKLKTDPDPVEVVESPAMQATVEAASALTVPTVSFDAPTLDGGPITTPEQALRHVLAAAHVLRQCMPASPVSYLLLRALRWGEVRELGEIKPSELLAPPGEPRVALRSAAASGQWKQVLEIAENAMSQPTGRGWLDLQRYSVRACEELGYKNAATALRSELKCLLADFPQLPQAILSDDTGAANPETLAWLEKEGLLPK